MLEGLAADTSVITYLMAAVGVLGIFAKIVNHLTLHRLVRAAGNMPKSTHKLIKLVRAKYEHACMIRYSVENIDAFVEKYIYEYRGFLFRIHTWRQIEILSVWFAGILAALGASVLYFYSGFSESVYQYIAAGTAETVLLMVIMRLSDEPYKVNAIKMYMVDYLENICTFRLRRQSAREREFIDVISAEGNGKNKFQTAGSGRSRGTDRNASGDPVLAGADGQEVYAGADAPVQTVQTEGTRAAGPDPSGGDVEYESQESRTGEHSLRNVRTVRTTRQSSEPSGRRENGKGGLSINIEGEPRNNEKGETAREALRHAAQTGTDDDRPALREEAIRQILEEFLA